MRRRAKPGEAMAWLKAAVESPGDDCQLWPFGRTHGYGQIHDPRTTRAHRLALILYSGRNPKHLDAAHGLCHNRACCNPRHLSWKTREENERDKVRDGTSNRGERCGSAKLTEDDVRAIRKASGTQVSIAKDFRISKTHVSAIKNRKTWGHLS